MSKSVKKKFGTIHPIVVRSSIGLIEITRAGKKVTLSPKQIQTVKHERRAMRGHCLVIETNKPHIFKQSERACKEAMAYIMELMHY
jgi:hypothetical protein